jgi:coatomer subunit beta'
LVAIACEDTFYVLRFSRENYVEAVQAGQVEEDGVESAFEVITDINESVRTGEWVGDCFIYTNSTNRLNYLVGDQTYTVSHFDKPMYILGYIQRDSRIYLADKDVNVTSFGLSLPVLEYQTLVLREDMETAAELLPTIPSDQLNKIARFLEGQGHKELALEVASDPEHKFELAIGLNQLDIALELARAADADHKWKTVGDAALAAWDVSLATECFTQAKDLGSLLLLHSSTGDLEGLAALAAQAEEAGAHNVAFSCRWLTGDVDRCVEALTKTGRLAEAVLFAQTYKPSLLPTVVGEWKENLEKNKKARVAKLIGVPVEDEELFPEWDEWLRLEKEGGAVSAAEPSNGNGKLVDVEDDEGAEAEEEEEEEEEEEDEDDDEDEE